MLHWFVLLRKCLLWNPSVKNQRFLPAPFGKGAFAASGRGQCARWLSAIRYFPDPPGIGGQWPQPYSHDSFLSIATSLTRPVSLPCRRLRLYLPPGGRWLGAQPQAGESHGVPPQSISHGSFLRIVTSLTRPVSLPCRRLRLYLPPGGRWLGAQPQDGGSHRAHSQFDCQRWNFPKAIPFPVPVGENQPVKSA